MKEADYYSKLEDKKVHCLLCPQDCIIAEGKRGFCLVRRNEDGKLYAETYDRILACNLDPIEKKPLYHFHPGSLILSIGTRGCNQRCSFCQNWQMLETDEEGTKVTSDQISRMADRDGSIGVAYTYNEPFIWYEFLMECAPKVRRKELVNVMVTNGLVNKDPLEDLLPFIDAMNIDLKSMDPGFYRDICRSQLEPVLNTIRRAVGSCHVEITNLLIPTLNDSDEQIEALVDFIAGLGRSIPLHFSAYYPCYKMTISPTPLETLERARRIASKKLDYVYLGNVSASEGSDTCCPGCGEILVERRGYSVRRGGLEDDCCTNCGRKAELIVYSS